MTWDTNWVSVWLQRGKKFKVFKLSCQSLDLNRTEMWQVFETRISCLLSWSSSEWIVGSKLILSGITTYWVYMLFILDVKGKRRSFESAQFLQMWELVEGSSVCLNNTFWAAALRPHKRIKNACAMFFHLRVQFSEQVTVLTSLKLQDFS